MATTPGTATTTTRPTAPGGPGDVERLVADEHAEVRTHLGHLRTIATALPTLDESESAARVRAALDFLTNGLLPHAALEEEVLYPAVDAVTGAGTTTTMSLDHEAIKGLVADLEGTVAAGLDGAPRLEAQRLLFVLEGLVSVHLHKEEAAYLPLLGRLPEDAYAALHTALLAHAGGHAHVHDARS